MPSTFNPSCAHANIATTLAFYTFPNPEKAKAELKKLTETVKKKYGVKV